MKSPKYTINNINKCVACGACANECPRGAIEIINGCYAQINPEICVGCGLCVAVCPAGSLELTQRTNDNEQN